MTGSEKTFKDDVGDNWSKKRNSYNRLTLMQCTSCVYSLREDCDLVCSNKKPSNDAKRKELIK